MFSPGRFMTRTPGLRFAIFLFTRIKIRGPLHFDVSGGDRSPGREFPAVEILHTCTGEQQLVIEGQFNVMNRRIRKSNLCLVQKTLRYFFDYNFTTVGIIGAYIRMGQAEPVIRGFNAEIMSDIDGCNKIKVIKAGVKVQAVGIGKNTSIAK